MAVSVPTSSKEQGGNGRVLGAGHGGFLCGGDKMFVYDPTV